MIQHNPLWRLALRPFSDGTAQLSDLLRFLDECIENDSLAPFSSQAILEVLDHATRAAHNAPEFSSWVSFLVLSSAIRSADRNLIALSAGELLLKLAAADQDSADQTQLFLTSLDEVPAEDNEAYARSLVAGLHALVALRAQPKSLNRTILERFDAGLMFPGSPFKKGELAALFWNSSLGKTEHVPQQALRMDEILLLCQESPDLYETVLVDRYERTFFALRKWRLAVDALEDPRFAAVQDELRDTVETLETPGLEYLSPDQEQGLKKYRNDLVEKVSGGLQSCIFLLNQAGDLLRPGDPWPVRFWIDSASAEIRLVAYDWTGQSELLRSAFRSSVQAAWSTRRSADLYFLSARRLVAKVYKQMGKSACAARVWRSMLRYARRLRSAGRFGGQEAAATAGLELASLALAALDPEQARQHCLDVLEGGLGFFETTGKRNSDEYSSLTDWSADLFDVGLVSCAATKDIGLAVKIAENGQRAYRLTTQLGATPVSDEALGKRLPNDQAIAYISTTDSGLGLIILAKNFSDSAWIPRFTLTQLKHMLGPWFKTIYRFREAPSDETLTRFQQGIDLTLGWFQPIAQLIAERLAHRGIRRLVLMPGRGFALLPLHAIPLKAEDRSADRLGDLFEIVYAPNASVWARLSDMQEARGFDGSFSGIADPCFSREVTKAAAIWDCVREGSTPSSVPEFMAAAKEAAIIHISSHGEFEIVRGVSGVREVRASLKLGGVTVDWMDIEKDLRIEKGNLVILSACDSLVLSHRDRLNQQFGLPYAFLAAGALLVLGSSWVVEGVATLLLVTRFHGNVAKRKCSCGRALKDAQAWLRQLSRIDVMKTLTDWFGSDTGESTWVPPGNLPYSHPYYWAGFHLFGADIPLSLVERSRTSVNDVPRVPTGR